MDTELLERYEELASSYNTLRSVKQGELFTTPEFAELIKFTKINRCFTRLWIKYGLAIKVGKKWKFPDTPVFWNKLKCAYEEMREISRVACRKTALKKKETKKTEPKETQLSDLLKTWNISDEEVAKYVASLPEYRVEKRIVTETWESL